MHCTAMLRQHIAVSTSCSPIQDILVILCRSCDTGCGLSLVLICAHQGWQHALMVMTVLCDGKALLVTFTSSMKRSMLSGTTPLSHPAKGVTELDL